MAGHNKWSKIKHRKAVVDKRRGKHWTKCARLIIVAAKHGGPDPDANLSLRYAIDEARYYNMPRETIERAIKKGCGELGDENYEHVRYEGYGPGGVAIVIEALTNNRTRTAADVRLAFSKFGGNLGATGAVSFMFQQRGELLVTRPPTVSSDQLLELALDAGALDVLDAADPDDASSTAVVTTEPASFHKVRMALSAQGLTISGESGIRLAATNMVAVDHKDGQAVLDLVDALEDYDDVQKVYANADVPDSLLQTLQ
jgi:YebC/PmpR family DNA-binding regulatory protein